MFKLQKKISIKFLIIFFKRLFTRKKIIFIVEDNSLYSKSLQGFLSTRFPELKIEAFSNGEACLLQLHRNPTIIIMDYQLNAGNSNAADGLSIIQKIKTTSSKTNIILLSAQTELDVFVKAISIYGCTYLRKDEQAFKKVEHFIKGILRSSKYSGL